jgi:hypothetical protein
MGPAKWSYFYLYVIIDIFSRRVVGWCVADRESADFPTALDRIRRLCYISYARSKSCAGSMPSNTTSIGFPSGRVGGGIIGRDHLTMHCSSSCAAPTKRTRLRHE